MQANMRRVKTQGGVNACVKDVVVSVCEVLLKGMLEVRGKPG